MNPLRHNPEFRDAHGPITLDMFDGRAVEAARLQQLRLEAKIGRVDRARTPNIAGAPMQLFGHNVTLENGTNVQLSVETDQHGEVTNPDDQAFVDARNVLAIMRSRERSRGSRLFNFAFHKDRGAGHGNTYEVDQAQQVYLEELGSFIERKVTDGTNPASAALMADHDLMNEAVGRAIVQEQLQMSALEKMAAETKSRPNRMLNFLRNHKKTRFAIGVALSATSIVGFATGQLEIALPAMALRTALSAEGGYLMGRTGWDAFQGARARRKPAQDIRNASHIIRDTSGRMTARNGANHPINAGGLVNPVGVFQRFVHILGAEARAGSHDPRRQEAATRLAAVLHEHYTDAAIGGLDMATVGSGAAGASATIAEEVGRMYDDVINAEEQGRLASDQTQSRKRHIAGMVTAVAFGSLPGLNKLGLIPSLHTFGVGFGGDHHTAGGGGSTPNGGGSHVTHSGGHTTHHSGSTTHVGSGENVTTIGNGNHIAVGNTLNSTDIHAHGSAFDTTHGHTGGNHHGAGHNSHHGDGNYLMPETDTLHVAHGGGFISTLQHQYNMTPVQAEDTYRAMYHSLHGAHGTYMNGTDIRISSPGDFKLPTGAQTILENKLNAIHHVSAGNAHHGAGAAGSAHNGVQGSMAHPGQAGPNGVPGNANVAPLSQVAGSATHENVTVTTIGNGNEVIVDNVSNQVHLMVNGHEVSQSTLHGLKGNHLSVAEKNLAQFITNDGKTPLSAGDRTNLTRVINHTLTQRNGNAQPAVDNLRHLWDGMHHNLANLTTDDAEEIENNLILAHAA